jgi:CRP/FNR family transcriptional regulator, anaerobic regulatory protein
MIPMTSNVELAGRTFGPTKLQPPAKSGFDRANTEFRIGGAGTQQIRRLKTGESLFLQGDKSRSIWVLREGWAFRYQSLEDGRRQIVDFLLPGDVLGIGASPQMRYGVEALSPCTWITISRESFLARLSEEPELSVKVVNMLSAGQVRAFEQMTSVGRRTARERVAHLLFDLAKRVQGSASDCEEIEITMPLMLSHIGDALGLATETVCRCLGELKRAGILAFSAGRLEIRDLDGLSDLAGLPVDDEEGEDRQGSRLVA